MSDNSSIRAVAFDMDGLMFNTEDIYDIVISNLLEEFGHEFTRELKHRIMGLQDPVAIGVLKDACNLPNSVAELQDRIQSNVATRMETDLQLLPGLEALLIAIETAEIPKAVATSSSPNLAHRALGLSKQISRFEFILTSVDVVNGKPHPEIYQTAAKRFGIETVEMLVLEDSVNGSRAAVASGARTVAVPGSHSLGQDFSHVWMVAESLADQRILDLF